MESFDQSPEEQYQIAPSTGDIMDTIRDNARNLSDAIRLANQHGISVHVRQSFESEPDAPLFEIVYLY